jgi:hypothetical protein
LKIFGEGEISGYSLVLGQIFISPKEFYCFARLIAAEFYDNKQETNSTEV